MHAQKPPKVCQTEGMIEGITADTENRTDRERESYRTRTRTREREREKRARSERERERAREREGALQRFGSLYCQHGEDRERVDSARDSHPGSQITPACSSARVETRAPPRPLQIRGLRALQHSGVVWKRSGIGSQEVANVSHF